MLACKLVPAGIRFRYLGFGTQALGFLNFKYHDPLRRYVDVSRNKDSGRSFHDEGHQSTKNPNDICNDMFLLDAVPAQMSFVM